MKKRSRNQWQIDPENSLVKNYPFSNRLNLPSEMMKNKAKYHQKGENVVKRKQSIAKRMMSILVSMLFGKKENQRIAKKSQKEVKLAAPEESLGVGELMLPRSAR
jgi:hypothetical protein